jgi:carbonic anhydrase
VPRLSRALHLVPQGARVVVELDGSFMDHAAFEALQDWQNTYTAQGGTVELTGRRAGVRIAEPGDVPAAHTALGIGSESGSGSGADTGFTDRAASAGCRCRPWTPWRNHQCEDPRSTPPPGGHPSDSGGLVKAGGTGPSSASGHELARGISAFQRNTAPLVRGELARLAREGQRPAQLFLTCADSRLVTSMITSSGPGDLFVVRNVGNLVPMPGEESGDDSVAAAIEYAVDVLKVRSITVCGHSGCGAMQALLNTEPGGARTPLKRWLRHGLPSLERMADDSRPWARLAGRAPADAVEQLSLTNVVQQLEHLSAHESVARALRKRELELHGMYFHVGEAQAYLLTGVSGDELFDHVEAADVSA